MNPTPVSSLVELSARPSAVSVLAGVAESDYRRLLGYPADHIPGERARELAAAARDWYAEHGRPWMHVREAELAPAVDGLRFDGIDLNSRLHHQFDRWGARRAVMLAVSAGPECEAGALRLWQEAKPDEYFFLEILGSAVVEHLLAEATHRICALADAAGLVAMPHYSPGYAGWDVAEQNKLYALITRNGTTVLPEDLAVLATGMLKPKKSQLAIVALAPRTAENLATTHQVPCERCTYARCDYRRAAYRHPVVAPAEPGPRLIAADAPIEVAPEQALYTVNVRALKKWADERVALRPQSDGSMEALFRFDGTTCSNLGQPLALEYRVKLSGATEGHVVLAADCRPAPGDEGHRAMCAYLNDSERLLRSLATEGPMLGQPLGHVLAVHGESTPSGCACTAENRAHKWRLALEAIHFALGHPARLVPHP